MSALPDRHCRWFRAAPFPRPVDGAAEIAAWIYDFSARPPPCSGSLLPGETAQDRLRNHAMQQLSRAVGVRRPDDVHRKLRGTCGRHQVHVERHFRCGVGARRLDRLVLLGRVLNRAVHLRGADLDEALEPVALHQLLAQARERHRVGLEEAPRMLPRHRALALRGEIDDDLAASRGRAARAEDRARRSRDRRDSCNADRRRRCPR